MITFTTGNLLSSDADALVNTVNTVGVMGKGVALMFKEAYPENFKAYEAACKGGCVEVGKMFVVARSDLVGPKWIINFPTKKHWRNPSKMEWVTDGLSDLVEVIRDLGIRSIAIPPLGAGNGGLNWPEVRARIVDALSTLDDVDVVVFQPTATYQNVVKRSGVERLTPSRALMAEMVRQYWVLGMECSLIEIQKLAWFLERSIALSGEDNPLNLGFTAHRYGPYADRLRFVLNDLDGSYLHCHKRISDAGPLDTIWFEDKQADHLQAFLTRPDSKRYAVAMESVQELVDGFQSPFGLELLATVDWLVHKQQVPATVAGVKAGIQAWPYGAGAAARKASMFSDRFIAIALEQLQAWWDRAGRRSEQLA
jgi:O-acetyl-ADP-ribose deacetylase (regulator of RNase III)